MMLHERDILLNGRKGKGGVVKSPNLKQVEDLLVPGGFQAMNGDKTDEGIGESLPPSLAPGNKVANGTDIIGC